MSDKCEFLRTLVAVAEAAEAVALDTASKAQASYVAAAEVATAARQALADCLAGGGDPQPEPGPIPQPMDVDLDMGEPR